MRQSGFEPELLAWKARVIPGYTTGALLTYILSTYITYKCGLRDLNPGIGRGRAV